LPRLAGKRALPYKTELINLWIVFPPKQVLLAEFAPLQRILRLPLFRTNPPKDREPQRLAVPTSPMPTGATRMRGGIRSGLSRRRANVMSAGPAVAAAQALRWRPRLRRPQPPARESARAEVAAQ